jgi:hypothetical protein
MTRLGKTARLPREIREELNVRLNNGEMGTELVEWLNGLPAVRTVLEAKFQGRPISPQNLSEWKQGGYKDWLRHQENCAYATRVAEKAARTEAIWEQTAVEFPALARKARGVSERKGREAVAKGEGERTERTKGTESEAMAPGGARGGIKPNQTKSNL